jgi:ubiquinone/menaquinone biosynthesis C-methylase UbiE
MRIIRTIINWLLDPASTGHALAPSALLRYLQSKTLRPVGDTYYGATAEEYEAVRSGSSVWEREDEHLRDIIKKLAPLENVLDVPCGTGRFFGLYDEFKLNISGLDSSDDMLLIARQKLQELNQTGNGVLVRGSATSIPFPSKSFDLVVCTRFLRAIISLSDSRLVMKEIGRLTSRWAVVELEIRPPKLKRKIYPVDSIPMGNSLYQEEIETLVRQSGLEVVEILGPVKPGTGRFLLLLAAL